MEGGADEFVRDAGLDALAWLTAARQIDRDETARYLRDLYSILRPQDGYVWVGWQQAVAYLGLEDLVPLVEEAFRRQWVDPMMLSLRHFREELRKAVQSVDPTELFDQHKKQDRPLPHPSDRLAAGSGTARQRNRDERYDRSHGNNHTLPRTEPEAVGMASVRLAQGDSYWNGAYGTLWWADPAEDLAVVFVAQVPGEQPLRFRPLINFLVYQALTE